MASVYVDNNNNTLLDGIYFYLKQQSLFGTCSSYILDNYRKIGGQTTFMMIPTEPLRIPFETDSIEIRYETASPQPAATFQSGIVTRFDVVHVSSSRDLAHLERFLTLIADMEYPQAKEGQLVKFTWEKEYWKCNKAFAQRSLDTIYLPEKKKTELVQTLHEFLNGVERQELYQRLGIPYKCVILLHGLPGTGKTSIIRALASHYKYNLAILKSVIEMDDNSFEDMLSSLRKRVFLVLEDVDCLFEQRQIQRKSTISYSGILNLLDGIGNYEKLVVFITTNYLNQLDTAFKRRIDLFVEFSPIQTPEVKTMYRAFFTQATDADAQTFANRIRKDTLTVNMLEKYFMYCIQNKLDPLTDDLVFLRDYREQTSDSQVSKHLYG